MSEFETDTLLQLVGEKRDCLLSINAMGIKQAELIEQENMTALLDLLAAKHKLAECEALLTEIIGREKGSEDELVRRRDSAAVRLQGAHAAGVARGAYSNLEKNRNSQLDISSDK